MTSTSLLSIPDFANAPIKRKGSLRYKAMMCAIALSTVPVFLTGSLIYYLSNQSIIRQITQDQTLRAELLSSQVNTFLLDRQHDVSSLANSLLLSDPSLGATVSQKQDTIADFLSTLGYFDSIILFDVSGDVIAQASIGIPFTGNYSDRGYFQQALQTGEPVINGPGLSKSSGKLRVEYAVPVKSKATGETVAVIRARIPGYRINRLFSGLEINNYYWHLVDQDGLVFAGVDQGYLNQSAAEKFPGFASLRAQNQAGSGIFPTHLKTTYTAEEAGSPNQNLEQPKAKSKKSLLSYAPVRFSPELSAKELSVLLSTDTYVALASQRHMAMLVAVGTGLAAVIAGAIAILLTDRTLQPIQALTDTARNTVEEGRFDLRAEIVSQDEVGILAASLNQLIDWIGIRTEELEISQLVLEQRTQELSAIINSLGDGLLVTDESGRIARFNPPLLNMFSHAENILVGAPIVDAFSADLNHLVLQSQEASGQTVSAEVALADDRTGQALVSVIIDPESGSPAGRVILIRDITTEKEIDQMKTDFISTVSHELRTPLTSVLGFAKIIQKKLNTVLLPAVVSEDKKTKRATRQVKDNLQIIVSEGERLTSLINDVLDIAKIESGTIEWRMVEIDVGEVVKQAIASTSVLAENNRVVVRADIASNLPVITADRDRLVQVVINLVSNAIKFSEDGTVTCEVKNTEDELRISVIDTGIGISEADQAEVFERFKQVGEIMTDKPKGTGLGLPICKQIIAHHGGRIWVESELGQGSNFSVALPIKDVATTYQAPTVENLVRQLKADIKQTTRSSTKQQQKVLVVDDEVNIRQLLRQELETEGYQVEEAKDGVVALSAVKQDPPDLIITDVMMPRLDGFDLTAVLKSNPETAHIPTIILSIVEDRDRGFRLGVDRYLSKPIDVSELLQAVETLIADSTTHHKVLVVDRNPAKSKKLAEILLSKGYIVAEASTGKAGLDKARSIKPDIMIVEAALCEEHKIIKTLRFEQGLENIFVILIEDILD